MQHVIQQAEAEMDSFMHTPLTVGLLYEGGPELISLLIDGEYLPASRGICLVRLVLLRACLSVCPSVRLSVCPTIPPCLLCPAPPFPAPLRLALPRPAPPCLASLRLASPRLQRRWMGRYKPLDQHNLACLSGKMQKGKPGHDMSTVQLMILQ